MRRQPQLQPQQRHLLSLDHLPSDRADNPSDSGVDQQRHFVSLDHFASGGAEHTSDSGVDRQHRSMSPAVAPMMEESFKYMPLAETCQQIRLPISRVLDRQGFGSEVYRSGSGKDQMVIRTATDLLPYRVSCENRQLMEKPVAQFYAHQNQKIADFLLMERHIHNVTADVRAPSPSEGPIMNYYSTILPLNEDLTETAIADEEYWQSKVVMATSVSTLFNLTLAVINLYVSISSNSLSVVASTVDTVLDLVTSLILSATSRVSQARDPYMYPGGKARAEPIGILVFAVLMGLASMAIVAESIDRLVIGFTSDRLPVGPNAGHGWMYLVVYCINVCFKAIVILFCFIVKSRIAHGSSTLDTLSREQRYDLMTYTGAFFSAAISGIFPSLWFLDASTATLLALFIAANWLNDAREHIQHLLGKCASHRFLNQLTYLALRHDSRISFIDQVQAYHFGERLMCEVHIGLPANMSLHESHDIGESLQIKIEALDNVEIAHVHTDFEWCHPHPEHKIS